MSHSDPVSDTVRLIDAIRSLEATLRQRNPSPIKGERPANRRASVVKLPGSASSPLDDPHSKASKRTEKVVVQVRVVFLKIGEIDTQKEKYTADVFMQAKWREPSFDGRSHLTVEDVDWAEQWTPRLYIDNILGESKESLWYSLVFDDMELCTVYEKRRLSTSFLEYLELNLFPFDTQDLTITVTSERSETEVDLVEDELELCGVNVQSFKDEQEWRLHRHVETWRKVATKVFQNTKFKHPALSVACKASRRPGFFVWNIFFVMLFIASLAFSTFSVELNLPQNRLQLSFILLLTTVTFKFIVNQNLPRISYLTYLDKYILITMTILCTVCAWHSLVTIVQSKTDPDTAEFADRMVLIVLGAIFVGFHFVFIMWIIVVNKMTHKSLGRKEEEHENRQKVLENITDGGGSTTPEKPELSRNGTTHSSSKVAPSVEVILEDA